MPTDKPWLKMSYMYTHAEHFTAVWKKKNSLLA
jgi:hypothetical protein